MDAGYCIDIHFFKDYINMKFLYCLIVEKYLRIKLCIIHFLLLLCSFMKVLEKLQFLVKKRVLYERGINGMVRR